jgi:hypothetical protein
MGGARGCFSMIWEMAGAGRVVRDGEGEVTGEEAV